MNKADYYPITRALAYVSIVIRDLAAAVREAEEINGLYLIQRDSDVAYLSSDGRCPELILKAGSSFGWERICLEATNELSFDLLADRLKAENISFGDSSTPNPGVESLI